MNALKVFDNKDFGGIRALTIDGQPWFVGKDVAGVLGYANSRDALKNHVDEDDVANRYPIVDSLGREQLVTIINESGLYSLIFASKLPKAQAFKRWVTSEVIPAIRRTGGYVVGGETDFIIKTVTAQVAEQVAGEMARLIPEIVMETVKTVLQAVAGGQTTVSGGGGQTTVSGAPVTPNGGFAQPDGLAVLSAEKKPRKRCISYHGKIDKLPSELRNEIIVMLFQKNYTYMQVSESLKDKGHDVGYSSVARYANRAIDEMNRADEGVIIEI